MLYSPTVTTKSTETPTLGSLFATCDDRMEVFFDGVKYTDAAMSKWDNTSEVSIPPHTEVIAISCRDTGHWEGIVASTTTGIVTDGSWKCSSVKENNWMMSDFDDSAWNNADLSRGTNGAPKLHKGSVRPNITKNAYWIWSTSYASPTTEAYCRKRIEIPIFPTVTTKSTAAPTLESLFATCDDVMEVFLDGVNSNAAMNPWEKTGEVSIPPHTEVIAISCKDLGGEEGIVASTTTGTSIT